MKKFIYTLVILAFAVSLNAQWQADVRLTNDTLFSNTSPNNAWSIAVSGLVVHVVWQDYRNLNNEIYYKRSIDGGVSWGTDTRLTNNSATSYAPNVAVSGSVVHVVWTDYRDGNDETYYKSSTDAGVSWGVDTRLTNNTAWSFNPSVAVSGSVVHVFWHDNRDGHYEIYYKRSIDGGVSWGAETRLTNDNADSSAPSVTVSGSVVHVVWMDNRDGSFWEIYYKRSTDGGVNWGADTRLTVNPFESMNPCVAISGSVVHVVWYDDRNGSNEIFYKRSIDGGVSWGADTGLGSLSYNSRFPSIAVSGSFVHIVWYETRDGNGEIYYKRSTDAGLSWGTNTRLTNALGTSHIPSIAVSGSVLHVVWTDNRDGNYEIYYKRNPTGNTISIQNISTEIPSSYSLWQNYPNPFNPTTKIKFDVANVGQASLLVTLIVYDAMGREVQTLVNESLKSGTYEVTFDGSQLTSGVYFYKLITGDFSETKKMLLIK